MKNGIEFKGITKRYTDQGQLAVKGIDFCVPQGTLTTLLGPSGCGKTTTLRMIAGLESPSSGAILIDGVDVTTLSAAQRNVSLVFQSYALFPHMTILDNVRYGLTVAGVGRDEAARRAPARWRNFWLVRTRRARSGRSRARSCAETAHSSGTPSTRRARRRAARSHPRR